jgi:hypothetical protein
LPPRTPILSAEVTVIDGRAAPLRTLRAAIFAAVAVILLLALRAKSDGARPDLTVIVVSFALLTLLLRPLTSRERSLPVVFGGLLASQLLLHVGYLFSSTGQFAHAGSSGLFCSPATPASGAACLPTERGGVVLLSVQLIAAALFACWIRGADSVAWQLARQSFGALLLSLRQFAGSLFKALVAVVPPVAFSLSPKQIPAPRLHSSLFARECGRRGPPVAGRLVQPSGNPAPARFALAS